MTGEEGEKKEWTGDGRGEMRVDRGGKRRNKSGQEREGEK